MWMETVIGKGEKDNVGMWCGVNLSPVGVIITYFTKHCQFKRNLAGKTNFSFDLISSRCGGEEESNGMIF